MTAIIRTAHVYRVLPLTLAALVLDGCSGSYINAPPRDAGGNGGVVDLPAVFNAERGPGTRPLEGHQCMQEDGGLSGKPPGSDEPCQWLGLTPQACEPLIICEGCDNAGICPQYLFRGDPGAGLDAEDGDYAVRLHYWMDGQSPLGETCKSTNAFSLMMFWLANTVTDSRCPAGTKAWDISGQQFLRIRTRRWHAHGNLEVAIQQERDPALRDPDGGIPGAPETNPKRLLFTTSGDNVGRWVDAQISVCDLLKQSDTAGTVKNWLDPKRTTAVLIGVARDNFKNHGFYDPDIDKGIQRIDVDNVTFVPCPALGCPACN